jgi:non-ribosomal peptide synthetase component E (peptide arylation enzyme)
VPVPDEVYLEKACACLVLQPGAAAPTVASLGQVLAAAGLAKFKWPEHVQVYDAFPTTTSGKLSKPLLREQAAARLKGAAHETERRAPHGPAHLEAEGDGRVLPRQAGP